jgi:hypothetical protein
MYKLKGWDYLIFIPVIGLYKALELIFKGLLSFETSPISFLFSSICQGVTIAIITNLLASLL